MSVGKPITVLFLGPLQDLAGRSSIEVAAPINWQGLLDAVGPAVAEQLRLERVNIACRGKVLTDKISLQANEGDEIALLPPVSGG